MSVNGIFSMYGLGVCGIDSEHQRIMRELRALGIEPSGDKATDKAKLQRVQSSKNADSAQPEEKMQANKTFGETIEELAGINVQDKLNAESMTGATQIAELNRMRFLGAV